MIDNLAKQLNNRDPEQRKKAIMALAKTKDPAALRYLATVAKTDNDPDIRDLAIKAGRYIRKQASGAATEIVSRSQPSTVADSLYPEEKQAEAREPLPEEIVVSQADIDRAKGFVQQALNWHMREDNDKAAQLLSKAFRANPKLRYDSYTVGLAATVMGRPGNEAVDLLAPSAEELRQRTAKVGGPAVSSGQRLMAFLLFIGAAVVLVGYLLFPWIDFSPLSIMTLEGQQITLGEAIADFNQLMREFGDTLEELRRLATGPEAEQLNRFSNAINRGVVISFSGLDTTLVELGIRDIFDVMGFKEFIDIAQQANLPNVPNQDALKSNLPPPTALDYTLPLVPIMGIIAALLGFILLVRRTSSVGLWVTVIFMGLIGVVPFWHFFTDTRQTLLSESTNLSMVGQVNISTGTEVIAPGFWVSLAAQIAVLCLPFIALLLHPTAKKETA